MTDPYTDSEDEEVYAELYGPDWRTLPRRRTFPEPLLDQYFRLEATAVSTGNFDRLVDWLHWVNKEYPDYSDLTPRAYLATWLVWDRRE